MGLTTAQPVPASRLTRRFLLPAVAAVLGALVTAIPWLVATLDHDQIRALEARLAGEARHAGTVLPWDRGPALDAVASALADQLAARVTVIAPDGTRQQLIDGRWDTAAELLEDTAAIARVAAKLPYFGGWA